MPSPPSSSPSHRSFLPSSNAFSASQRTDLQSWMAYHHLPFSALTISEPPPLAVASSSRDLVVVSAIVGRGMLGSMRVELVVPREEVFRVQRTQVGRERRSEGSRVVIGSWEGGIEVEEKEDGDLWLEDVLERRRTGSPPSSSSTSRQQEPWFTRPLRGDHQRGGGGAAATVQFDFTPTPEQQDLLSSTSPPPSSTSPPPPSSHTHRSHQTHDPLVFTPLPGSLGSHTQRSTTQARSILSVRCGHLPPPPSRSKRAQHPPHTYLYPNPNLSTSPNPPSASSSPSNCANRLVLKLALPITTFPPSSSSSTPLTRQANFSFLSLPHQHPLSATTLSGPRPGRKFARGWIVDASLMEGRVGFLPSCTDGLGQDLNGSDWERVQCGCSSGLRKVGGAEEQQQMVRSLGCLVW